MRKNHKLLLGNLVRQNATVRPNETAIIYEDNKLTFKQLDEDTNKLANALIGIGVEKGDRVGILLLNPHISTIYYFACAKIGAVLVPISFMASESEMIYIINKVEVSTLCYSQDFFEVVNKMKEHTSSIERYILFEGNKRQKEMFSYVDLMMSASAKEPVGIIIDEDDPHVIIFTSGTTGHPKGAVISHRSYYLLAGVLTHKLTMSPKSIYLNAYPMFHMAGIVGVLGGTYEGYAVVMISVPPTSIKLLDAIQRFKVTHFLAVPTIWKRLLAFPDFDNYDLSSLKVAMGASDSMPEELLQQIHNRTSATCPQLYGLTEGGILTYLEADDALRKIGSSGQAHCQAELRVVDEKGNDVKNGETGEIICRSPHQMLYYCDMPEATASTINEDGWLSTGDLARFDEENYLYIVGRKKDMIISGGQNIYPAEIERVLNEHPSIFEACIVGLTDKEWGEAVAAAIVLEQNVAMTETEVIEYVRKELASYNKPKYVKFFSSLPRTAATGKLQKVEIRKNLVEEFTL